MKIYKVYTLSGKYAYVLSKSMDEACEKVEAWTKSDYYSSSADRVVVRIEVVAATDAYFNGREGEISKLFC